MSEPEDADAEATLTPLELAAHNGRCLGAWAHSLVEKRATPSLLIGMTLLGDYQGQPVLLAGPGCDSREDAVMMLTRVLAGLKALPEGAIQELH